MANVTFNFKNELFPEILDAFDAQFVRLPADNKAQHFKKIVNNWITERLMEARRSTAVTNALKNVQDSGPIE